ncbi:16S rRNA (cytosine(967)-C(5))-methyltransferase OS=Lysinibacillus sphaericus OX=1421 GN=rsmB PE=3 SV=1 [Lysinibacillus sphaericus]
MLHAKNVPPVQTVRVNRTVATPEQAIASLQAEGLTVQQSDLMPECLHVTNGQPARTKAFQDGRDYHSR